MFPPLGRSQVFRHDEVAPLHCLGLAKASYLSQNGKSDRINRLSKLVCNWYVSV